MSEPRTVYVIGAGSIGMPLAALLRREGRSVVAVRTSVHGLPVADTSVAVELPDAGLVRVDVPSVSLSELREPRAAIVAVTAKATANVALAPKLRTVFGDVPVIVMQNGIDVEQPYVDAGFPDVYRCVLYATGQRSGSLMYRFREVAESPIGAVGGADADLRDIVSLLATPLFRFAPSDDIAREAWRKSILNAAFNSICPLLGVDNGVFRRDEAVAAIAELVLREGALVAASAGIRLEIDDLVAQLMNISTRSEGQRISTLQDLEAGRETEIRFLNAAIVRAGRAAKPPVPAETIRVLGELIEAKERAGRKA